jgi:Zn-dependent peptidase ImmA (M78 family)
MESAEVQIDMMELADLGQPIKLAEEIHRQLRSQFGSVPTKMPLQAIARAVGITVFEEHDSTRIDGMLVIEDNEGAVSIRRGMRPGRKNFTLGHEIGHYLIPNHRFQRTNFQCASVDMGRERGTGNWEKRPPLERIEVEANEFAAALLVPAQEFALHRKRQGSGCDLSHIRALADIFAVSQEMMAMRYAKTADEQVAIVTSHNGIVRRVIPGGLGFPYMGLRRDVPLPPNCLTRSFRPKGNDPISGLVELRTDVWLERSANVAALYEQVFVQEDGYAMTLLTVEMDDADDADDSSWNRWN